MHYLQNLVKDNNCYINLNKPSWIDLILTNFPNSIMKTQTLKTALSDFHKFTLISLKMHFKKLKQKVVVYWDYKNLCNERFRLKFLSEIKKYLDCSFNDFHSVSTIIMDKRASLDKRSIKFIQKDFIFEQIMVRLKLRDTFLRLKTEEKTKREKNRIAYVRQHNYCVSILHQEKRILWQNKYKFYNWQEVALENCMPIVFWQKIMMIQTLWKR